VFADKFAIPEDPMVRMAGAITIGAVVLLVIIGRVFRDVNPA